MRTIALTLTLASALMLAAPAMAQQSSVSAPPAGEPESHPLPGVSTDTMSVTVVPDRSATPMADPQSAAEFGSPSAVDSPGSPMPNAAGWPTPTPSAKRPKWLQTAPDAKPQTPPPPH